MSLRLSSLVIAVAAVLSPLAAQAAGHDGFELVGDTLIYVGTKNAAPKSRAEVQAELAAYRHSAVQADGWQVIGDTLVFAAPAKGAGKTRAEVRAELAAWVANPQSHDGYSEIGGDSLRQYAAAKPMPADVKLAAGEGFSIGSGAAAKAGVAPVEANDTQAQLQRHFGTR